MDADQAKKLRTAFPPAQIGHLPKAGVVLDFVGHAATTDRLLQVDPEWTWRPFTIEERQQVCADPSDLWIWLTICGVTRPGVGDGKNAKERIGDAIRNAAMRFGVALDLWAKEDLHADAPEEPKAQQRTTAPAVEAPAGVAPAPAAPAASPFIPPVSATPADEHSVTVKATPRQLQTIKEMVPKAAAASGNTTQKMWILVKNAAGCPSAEMTDAVAHKVISWLDKWIESAGAQEELGGGVS